MKRRLMLLLTYLFVGFGLSMAQTKVVGIVISSEDGEPVVGASVLVKGTTIGTITDMDGNFSISNVPGSAKTLRVSYIGMKTSEVVIGRGRIKITLDPDNKVLDEVVVTAYGVSTKGTFTGSAGVMKADKIETRQVSNVSNALSGTVAGVQILSDNGQPGSSAKVRIRGVGSINSGTSPLYVVDGVPFDGDLSSINTQDIESLTVLKDAASTALYGARGANGIIMITTKKGKTGKALVTFDAKIGANSRAVKNYDVMSSPQQYTEKTYEAIYNAGLYNLKYDAAKANKYANTNLFTKANGGYGYQIYTVPTGESVIGMDGKLNPNATLGYTDGKYYYTPDNWGNETFANKIRQEYNASVSASTERMNYYSSFGYLEDNGIIQKSGFKRYTGRLKGDYKVYDWLKIGGNFGYTYSNSQYPSEQTTTNSSGNAFFIANMIAPVYPIYVRNSDGTIMYNNGRKVYDYGDGKSTKNSRSFMSIANPAGDLIYNKEEYLMDIMNLNWFAELTPLKGLTLTARFGMDIDNTRYNQLGNALYGQNAQYGGTAYQSHSRTFGLDKQFVGNYQFSVAEKHHIDLTAGYDGYNYEYTILEASGQNLYNPESFYINNSIDQRKGYGGKDSYATAGAFGRANYNYDDKYFGSISYRRDGSSRFTKDNRWGDFYSASAAWVLTREDFMKKYTWLNMLKLKASIGQQGNDDLLYSSGVHNYAGGDKNYYPYADQFKMTGANGVFSDGALYYKGNKDLTWETSTSYNIGVDFAMLENKLNGTIEYFGRKSSDMLYNKPVAPIAGYSSIPMNIGSMRNTGLELDLSYQIINTKTLSWDVNANATFIKNKILKLHPDLNGQMIDGTRIYTEGKSMYRMYLVKYAGVDPDNGMALYWAKDDKGNDIKTNDWSVASNYKQATADLLPTVYGGFGTTFRAYGFDFSIQCAYQLGGEIYDSGYSILMHGGTTSYAGNNWSVDILKSWTEANKNTDVPRVDAADKYANSTSDRWITSSDYLSINNITMGYTLPVSLLNKLMVSKLRLFIVADNVALFSARKGLDPRQSYTSATTALYTPIRTVSGGISLTF